MGTHNKCRNHPGKHLLSLKKIVNGSEDKEPTEKQLETVKAHLGELHVLLARLELEDSSSESDSDSDSSECDDCSDSDDSVECDGDSCSNSEKRKYKKGPRSMGYSLFLQHGGTRAQWSDKSEKYKNRYYERNKDNM